MILNKKIQITSILLLFACAALPLVKISNSNTTQKNSPPPPHIITRKKNTGYVRSVTKFTSTHEPSQFNLFNEAKQKFEKSNIAATTSNTSNFNMNICYFGFNSFGIKVRHVVKSVGGNLKQPNINIGLLVPPQMKVQVPKHSSA